MGRGDGLPEGSTARIERLLEHYDPNAVDYALARFAVEKIVADLPDAAFEEHEVFASAKLEEARLVEEALDRLAALDGDMEEAVKAALGALREARFDDVDAALAEAEDRSAVVDARVWARSARAEAALVPGNATAAVSHYATAAGYLAAEQNDSEGRDEATPFRSRAVGRLIRHADTFGGDGGWIGAAMEMCHANIGPRDMHQWNRGARQMDAGSAQLSAGRLKEASEALNLFLAAEYAFRIASWHFDRDRFPVDWAAAQNARGLAQANCCFRYEEATGETPPEGSWLGAEGSYRSAMEVQQEAGELVQWAKTGINLGYLLVHRGRAEGGEAGREFLRQAIEGCRAAQSGLRPEMEADVWADAQQILAGAILDLAEIDPDDAKKHLLQATAELTTAQAFLAGQELPLRMASVDRLMARLRRQIERTGQNLGAL